MTQTHVLIHTHTEDMTHTRTDRHRHTHTNVLTDTNAHTVMYYECDFFRFLHSEQCLLSPQVGRDIISLAMVSQLSLRFGHRLPPCGGDELHHGGNGSPVYVLRGGWGGEGSIQVDRLIFNVVLGYCRFT